MEELEDIRDENFNVEEGSLDPLDNSVKSHLDLSPDGSYTFRPKRFN